MHKFRTLAVFSLAMLAVVAFAAGASACDGKAKASTADAKTASAEMKAAGSGCSSSAKAASADAKVAGAGCSSSAKAADAKVAGAGCSSSAKTADAKVAGVGCSSSAMKTAGAGCTKEMEASHAKVAMEAVRMPSGALAVFYNGRDAETVEMLHAKAEAKGAAFGCGIAGAIASNENCNVEVATTEHGIMLLVTSEKAELLDEFQESYAVAMNHHGEEADSE